MPEWSKGADLSSAIVTDAWVRTPPDAFLLREKKEGGERRQTKGEKGKKEEKEGKRKGEKGKERKGKKKERKKGEKRKEEKRRKEKKNETTVKHSCPSGLRGPSQERLSQDAWVRTPPDAFLLRQKYRNGKKNKKKERIKKNK